MDKRCKHRKCRLTPYGQVHQTTYCKPHYHRALAIDALRVQHVQRLKHKAALGNALVNAVTPSIDKPAKRSKPAWATGKFCSHSWDRLDDRFERCTTCRVLRCYKPTEPSLSKLPALLRGRELPSTDAGRLIPGYADIVVLDDFVRLRKTLLSQLGYRFIDEYALAVRFPKGWLWCTNVSTMQWDRVFKAAEPYIDKRDPFGVYAAVQKALYPDVSWPKNIMEYVGDDASVKRVRERLREAQNLL